MTTEPEETEAEEKIRECESELVSTMDTVEFLLCKSQAKTYRKQLKPLLPVLARQALVLLERINQKVVV